MLGMAKGSCCRIVKLVKRMMMMVRRHFSCQCSQGCQIGYSMNALIERCNRSLPAARKSVFHSLESSSGRGDNTRLSRKIDVKAFDYRSGIAGYRIK
jgi:hypothetical protein